MASARLTTIGAFHPKARRQRLLVSRVGGDTVVYDLETHEAHGLSPFATRLWEACDGRSTVAGLRAAHDWTERDVVDGLERLGKAGLLVEAPPASTTRRRAIARLARAAAVPAVVSILVPDSASAQSCLPLTSPCTSSISCCSGCCRSNGGPSIINKCALRSVTFNHCYTP